MKKLILIVFIPCVLFCLVASVLSTSDRTLSDFLYIFNDLPADVVSQAAHIQELATSLNTFQGFSFSGYGDIIDLISRFFEFFWILGNIINCVVILIGSVFYDFAVMFVRFFSFFFVAS